MEAGPLVDLLVLVLELNPENFQARQPMRLPDAPERITLILTGQVPTAAPSTSWDRTAL